MHRHMLDISDFKVAASMQHHRQKQYMLEAQSVLLQAPKLQFLQNLIPNVIQMHTSLPPLCASCVSGEPVAQSMERQAQNCHVKKTRTKIKGRTQATSSTGIVKGLGTASGTPSATAMITSLLVLELLLHQAKQMSASRAILDHFTMTCLARSCTTLEMQLKT